MASARDEMRCRCVWRGEQCPNQMTQEDGLCNWCGNGRAEEQLRDDPRALVIGDKFYGIAGGDGQLHDFRSSDPPGTAAACWYSGSGRRLSGTHRIASAVRAAVEEFETFPEEGKERLRAHLKRAEAEGRFLASYGWADNGRAQSEEAGHD